MNSLGFEMRLWTADNGGGFALVNPEALTDCIRRALETALASAATLLDRLAGILEPVREDMTREMCADDFGPEAVSTPAAEAENL